MSTESEAYNDPPAVLDIRAIRMLAGNKHV